MAIKVKHKDWHNEPFRNAILSVAEVLGEDIEIELPKKEFYPYNAQIWKDDEIIAEKDFKKKPEAIKWTLSILKKKLSAGAYADLKKYNKKEDDFDWWFFKLHQGKLEEVITPEVEL